MWSQARILESKFCFLLQDLPAQGSNFSSTHCGQAALLCEPGSALGLLLPSYKGPCDHSGPTWIIQDNLLISRSLNLNGIHKKVPFTM